MEYNNSHRKSSSATVVPPPKNRKVSIPLTINCSDTGTSVFYDTGSMTDMSPTTAVSSKRHLPIYPDPSQDTSFLSTIKSKFTHLFQNNTSSSRTTSNCSTEKAIEEDEQSSHKGLTSTSTLGKKPSSFSDPHLSPGSTAVDDEERQGYFGSIPAKKKKSPRGWVAAILMVIVGALIAVTFVLVGLGKALGGNNTTTSLPPKTTITTSLLPTPTIIFETTTATAASQLNTSPIHITFTVLASPPPPSPTQTS